MTYDDVHKTISTYCTQETLYAFADKWERFPGEGTAPVIIDALKNARDFYDKLDYTISEEIDSAIKELERKMAK